MLTITKPVYYCEFCKRHRLTKDSIEKHEPRCIYNPHRSACGWHREDEPDAPALHVRDFVANPDIEALRKKVSGCPACMLAVIVQARRNGLHEEEAWSFDYKAEVAKWREAEREEQYADVW